MRRTTRAIPAITIGTLIAIITDESAFMAPPSFRGPRQSVEGATARRRGPGMRTSPTGRAHTTRGNNRVIDLKVNGKPVSLDVDADMPLLWALRDELNLTGTKFGCGMAMCGACTVHLDGEATRSCVLPVSAAAGKNVTTIEGLSPQGEHPLQKAWVAESVPQCGYCQS
eukprot:gene44070-58767_t